MSQTNATPRKILVLGATSGIAEATCRIWAEQGARLFLVARNAQKLAAVAADLRTRGASYVDTAVADLDDTDQHPALLKRYAGRRITYDALYDCGVPERARIARQLQNDLLKIRP